MTEILHYELLIDQYGINHTLIIDKFTITAYIQAVEYFMERLRSEDDSEVVRVVDDDFIEQTLAAGIQRGGFKGEEADRAANLVRKFWRGLERRMSDGDRLSLRYFRLFGLPKGSYYAEKTATGLVIKSDLSAEIQPEQTPQSQ